MAAIFGQFPANFRFSGALVIYTQFYKYSGRVRGRVVPRLETGCGWICVS